MKEWKGREENWEKYWKKKWDKNMGDPDSGKYKEMKKIMNELGDTQFKTAKLIMQIANEKGDEEFFSETKDIEKKIKALRDDIDSMLKN